MNLLYDLGQERSGSDRTLAAQALDEVVDSMIAEFPAIREVHTKYDRWVAR